MRRAIDRKSRQARRLSPTVERVENRLLLATTFVVTTTADNGDDVNPIPGSLRQGILEADQGRADTIAFALKSDTTVPQILQVITPLAPLPAVTAAVTIDGSTQPGADLAHGKPAVEIDGVNAGPGANGLTLNADDPAATITVKGLIIVRFSFSGVEADQGQAVVQGNLIGTDTANNPALGNASDGVTVFSPDALIGGPNPADGNVISGNGTGASGGNGVTLLSPGNTVLNNLIGTSYGPINGAPVSFAAIPNSNDGVMLVGASDNVIGKAGAGNLIASNRLNGVEITQGSDGNVVQGNGIGSPRDTSSSIGVGLPVPGNQGHGVALSGSSGNTIGGPGPGQGNLISNNQGEGVVISGNDSSAAPVGNLVQGNRIGTDLNGVNARPNRQGGAAVFSVQNTIGGSTPGAGNLISGNSAAGLTLGNGSASNTVLGNRIGTDLTGTRSLGNGGDGVVVTGGINNDIGGPETPGGPVVGNLISANSGDGIRIGPNSTGNNVLGNVVGLTVGDNPLGNLGDGVRVTSPGNAIGGTAPGDRNVISANLGAGVEVTAGAAATPADPVLILGNFIGTSTGGVSSGQGNQQDGVLLTDAPGARVGGTAPGAGNLIAGNRQSGVHVRGVTILSTGETIQGNTVGLNLDGSSGLAANLLNGVFLENASGNAVGGAEATAGNVVSNNGAAGVAIAGGSDNRVQGNKIGTDPTGESARGNARSGVVISGGSGDTIGGPTAAPGTGPGNLISGNLADGVEIDGPPAAPGAGNTVQGNLIGTDLSGGSRLGNALNGVAINGSPSNTIGGLTAAPGTGPGNLIAGNGLIGVTVLGAGSSGNALLGNAIGTGRDGSTPLGNAQDGVLLDGVAGNDVGGSAPGARNLISANNGNGVEIRDPGASGNTVAGNWIGTTSSGESALGNAQNGVAMSGGATNNVLGGTTPGAGNLISGNLANGVSLFQGAASNRVLGNMIGTDALGRSRLGNVFSGVVVSNTGGNVIGAPGAGNLISGNSSSGVIVTGASATGNTVQANKIGTDVSGTEPLGNSATGVTIDSAPGNLIGGPASPSASLNTGNVISANRTFGVLLLNVGATGNQVSGNLIGTNADGSGSLGNALDGVLVNDAPGDTVGGPTLPLGNVISGNGGNGVRVSGVPSPGATVVRSNRIGTDPGGRLGLGNAFDGVLIDASTGSTVQANLISGNGRDGVEISGGSQRTTVQGNTIGADRNGAVPVANRGDGVALTDSPFNLIGGGSPGAGNLISGNLGNGITLAGTSGNHVQGNLIGTRLGGGSALGNGGNGVTLSGAGLNLIGGTGVGEGNLVSANGGIGIQVIGPGADRNVLIGDTVGTNASGTVALGNAAFGVSIEGAVSTLVQNDLISGNAVGGLQIAGFGSSHNLVYGNLIGTDRGGRKSLSNDIGVFINGAGSNVIGEGVPGRVNLISGNATAGVYVFGRFASANLIRGNRIGTDATGRVSILVPAGPARPAGKQQVGVLINQAPGLSLNGALANGNVIGGPRPADRNTISGNLVGVTISGTASRGNVVQGNDIGPSVGGGPGAGNGTGVFLNGAPGNVVGGSAGNVISGNSVVGVYILGTPSTGNVVAGNLIGLTTGGKKALPNSIGVYIENAPANTIGGSGSAAGNVISANRIAGVYVLGSGSTGNVVEGNTIGGTSGGPGGPGNGQYGVLLYNAPTNTVPQSGALGNKISGSGIANFREFTGAPVTANPSSVPSTPAKASPAIRSTGQATPAGPKSLTRRRLTT